MVASLIHMFDNLQNSSPTLTTEPSSGIKYLCMVRKDLYVKYQRDKLYAHHHKANSPRPDH